MTLFPDFNSSVNVPFQRIRQLLAEQGGGIQAGVVGSGDMKVAQRGAGANMSVDVPVGAAWVAITTGTRNGLGHVYSDAVTNVTVTGSNATNPRVDQIILRWNDSSVPTGTGNTPTLEVLTGTPTAGAQITNTAGANYRAGAAALPNDCLRLADVLVPAASSSVTTANIVDRRPWARGLDYVARDTTGTNYTTASAVVAQVGSNYNLRFECSGAPVEVKFVIGNIQAGAVPAAAVFDLQVDGLQYARRYFGINNGVGFPVGGQVSYLVSGHSAGSHTFVIAWAMVQGATTLTLLHDATHPIDLYVRETVAQNANNV